MQEMEFEKATEEHIDTWAKVCALLKYGAIGSLVFFGILVAALWS